MRGHMPNESNGEKNIYEVIKFHLEGLREEGISLPEQHTESEMMAFT